MRFGLDWDGTGEEAQELFLNFCKNAIALGNEVHIVTMRYPSEGGNIPKEFLDAVTGIHYTCRQAKGPFMTALGIKIHVWIDDNPRAVNESAHQLWDEVSPEGTVIRVKHTD